MNYDWFNHFGIHMYETLNRISVCLLLSFVCINIHNTYIQSSISLDLRRNPDKLDNLLNNFCESLSSRRSSYSVFSFVNPFPCTYTFIEIFYSNTNTNSNVFVCLCWFEEMNIPVQQTRWLGVCTSKIEPIPMQMYFIYCTFSALRSYATNFLLIFPAVCFHSALKWRKIHTHTQAKWKCIHNLENW